MIPTIRTAALMIVVLSIVTGVFYPLAITGIAQAVFPRKANGSIIVRNGRPAGSELIGQVFASEKYFWSRLSATDPFPYNAGASSGSNLGPMNLALRTAAKNRIDALRAADSTNAQSIPVDLVTSSGSGLDPHISIAAALYQVPRLARARKLPVERLNDLIHQRTEDRDLGFLGEPGVNVLKLNLALDGFPAHSMGGK